jgi:exosome complex RNA-binding protein Rrp4
MRIVIGQRGWVWIGKYAQTGDEVVLSDARCIRRWGTSKGLGEIAQGGPTKTTVLDPAGTVRLHRLSVVATLDANEEAWSGK